MDSGAGYFRFLLSFYQYTSSKMFRQVINRNIAALCDNMIDNDMNCYKLFYPSLVFVSKS